jgi:hypothetical protein
MSAPSALRLIALRRSVDHRMAISSHFAGAGQMNSRGIYAALAIAIAALVPLFIYSVVFVFRTGYVGAPF